MIKGLELKMIKKIPKGKYFTASEKTMKDTVPTAHRKISVHLSSLGISAKKLIFSLLMMRADAHILKKERKNTNS